ncbi:MAG: GH3 family domain-containing protein, partial [Akkermansiaceae bacterium]
KWLQSLTPYAEKHEHACRKPLQAQEQILHNLLEKNRDTEFGKDHGFSAISNYHNFTHQIPVRTYQDLNPWMKLTLMGEENILTKEAVIGYEQTSGSSGGRKLIPFTESFRQEMAIAIGGWMHRWLEVYPDAFNGPAYWSISPPSMTPIFTPGGARVGMDNDGSYFPPECARHIAGMLLNPPTNGNFMVSTANYLLDCDNLSSISAWSPTFILQLDQALRQQAHSFTTWKQQWPNLKIISCWTDAQAAVWLPELRTAIGEIQIEPKGLLSTEGVCSVPAVHQEGCVLAAGSHFIEFMRPSGLCSMLDQVEVGETYEIVLTTGAGLYRYRTLDQVKIESIDTNGLPTIRFIGRTGRHSDLVGEKLTEEFVAGAMYDCGARGILAANHDHYRFYTEQAGSAADLDQQLSNNPYYAQAIALGQLKPLETRLVPQGFFMNLIHQRAKETGTRLGDVKLPALLLSGEQPSWFLS